jgi:hypothetical protein
MGQPTEWGQRDLEDLGDQLEERGGTKAGQETPGQHGSKAKGGPGGRGQRDLAMEGLGVGCQLGGMSKEGLGGKGQKGLAMGGKA